MIGRKPRYSLDRLHPDVQRYAGEFQSKVKWYHVVDTVYARDFALEPRWKVEKVVAVTRPVSQKVQLAN